MGDPYTTSRLSPERPRRLVAGLLVLLGLGIVAHPLYIWPHYSQTAYTVTVEQLDETPAASIEYEGLPPATKVALDEAIEGEGPALWSGEHDEAIDIFEDRPVVRHDGAYYRVMLLHGDNVDFIAPFLRWVLSAVGALLVAIGGLIHYATSWTPLTPQRGLWIPVSVTIVFYATHAYDVLFSGVQQALLSIPSEIVLLIPVMSIALPIGSAVASGRDERMIAAGVVAMALLGVAIGGSLNPTVLLLVGGLLTIGGVPWFVLGYRLTSRD